MKTDQSGWSIKNLLRKPGKIKRDNMQQVLVVEVTLTDPHTPHIRPWTDPLIIDHLRKVPTVTGLSNKRDNLHVIPSRICSTQLSPTPEVIPPQPMRAQVSQCARASPQFTLGVHSCVRVPSPGALSEVSAAKFLVTVLWRDEGYTMKYCLIPRDAIFSRIGFVSWPNTGPYTP